MMNTPTPGTRPASGRGPFVAGVILVIIGGAFLVARLVDFELRAETWPIWVVAPGVALLVAAFAMGGRGGVGFAVPGAIVTTVGLVLWVQEALDVYATWAYAWALVAPGSVGLALLAYGLFIGDREMASGGLTAMVTGVGLFLVFGLFFEGIIGLSGNRIEGLDTALPVAVVALGVVLLVAGLFWRRGPTAPPG
jgi:hypothetical protein